VGRRLQEINILGGLILPVWGAVEKALAKQVCFVSLSCSLVLQAAATVISSLLQMLY
jgi:hypothetical protein